MSANAIEQLLFTAPSLQAPRRAFDVAKGLRRLAADAGYIPPAPAMPRVSRARQQLAVVARWEASSS